MCVVAGVWTWLPTAICEGGAPVGDPDDSLHALAEAAITAAATSGRQASSGRETDQVRSRRRQNIETEEGAGDEHAAVAERTNARVRGRARASERPAGAGRFGRGHAVQIFSFSAVSKPNVATKYSLESY